MTSNPKLERLYSWVTEEYDGTITQISAFIPRFATHMTLTVRDREVAGYMADFAEKHGRENNQRVWLREWTAYVDHEVIFEKTKPQ